VRVFFLIALLAAPSSAENPNLPQDDSYGIVLMMRRELKKRSDSSESRRLFPLFEKLDLQARELPQEERQALIEKNLALLSDAVRDLPRARESDPEIRRTAELAVSDLNNRAARWSEGRLFAERVLKSRPYDTDALVRRSMASSGLSDHGSAFADADKAAKLAPDSAAPYTARALAAYGLGKYQESLEDARRALALDPRDRTAFSLLKLAEARVPAGTGSDDPVRAEVQREYHGMVTQLNQAAQRGKEPEARPSVLPVTKLLRSAASKLAIKDHWGAIADAERALELDPTAGAAHYYQAGAYNLLGRYEEAAKAASLALQINPDDIPSRNARSWALIRLGRPTQGLADANHTLELNPSDAYAYFNRAYAHEKLGDIDSMANDLRRAMELNPQFEPAYRDAMAMHRPVISGTPKTPVSPLKSAGRGRSFLTIIVSSVVGGLLIAAGIVHIMTSRRNPGRPSNIDHTYEMKRVIGKGGMGLVYEAVDKALQRKVAIKMLKDELSKDEKARARFLDEARTVAALHHPAIVDIHSIIDADSGLYLVFEYIEGRTVEDILKEKGSIPYKEAKAIIRSVCQALEFAHRGNVVHRDLKPGNIMVAADGQVKVMDFGISRPSQKVLPAGSPAGTGTPYYMAPEQEYGVVRPESDIFSLGACFYEMLTGKPPFPDGQTNAKLIQNYERPSALVKGLPPAIDVLLDAAMAPDPDKRISDAGDFWMLLERAG
jgi:serine/threonine protein kinase